MQRSRLPAQPPLPPVRTVSLTEASVPFPPQRTVSLTPASILLGPAPPIPPPRTSSMGFVPLSPLATSAPSPPGSPNRANFNDALANRLLLIATYYDIERDEFRGKTYRNASTLLRDAPFEITSGSQARLEFKGIGPSVAKDIDEFLKTKKIQRLEDLQKKHADEKRTIDLFTSVYGIGVVSATKYFNMGLRTIEDLLERAPLTHAQRLGAENWADLQKKIPRAEIDMYKQVFEQIFRAYDPNLKWLIVGSYRRGEAQSGDIDVLIQANENLDLPEAVNLLKEAGIIVGNLALGHSKYLSISRLPGQPARRLDLLVVQPESWAYAQNYFTGSQRHNVLLRQRALDLGLTLNEYRLQNIETGETYPAETEEDIYNILGVQYIPPEERFRDLPFLPLLPHLH